MDKTGLKKHYRVRQCTHSAWRMIIIGLPHIYEDIVLEIGWECTQCGKILQRLNPFKDQDASSDTVMQEMEV